MLKVTRYLKDPKDRPVIPKDSLCVLILPNPLSTDNRQLGEGGRGGEGGIKTVKTGKTGSLDMRAGFDAAQGIQ